MQKTSLWLGALIIGFCSSCSNDDIVQTESHKEIAQEVESVEMKKEQMMKQFAQTLSSVVHQNQKVRELLKTEAIKQFDKNYDVLYHQVKDTQVGDETLRSLLVKQSSEKFISEIETQVPLLNILFPEIAMFNISPESYDTSDPELPVAIAGTERNYLYYNDTCTDELEKGQVPGFHILVINENSRVEVATPATRSSSPTFTFKSPAFDGSLPDRNALTRSATVNDTAISEKVVEAFRHFYAQDASDRSISLQRDYIYYGLTPEKTKGAFHEYVSEYISFIEVHPKAYFKIADQDTEGIHRNDPRIKVGKTSEKKRELSEKELIDRLWTTGTYDLRFEITKANQGTPQVVYVPIRPEEIWNFNLYVHRRHPTKFRHTRYTYFINPNDFTAKRFYLKKDKIELGKWNLAEEGLQRYVSIYEEDDEGVETESTYSHEITKVSSVNVNGNFKFALGLGNEGNLGFGSNASSTKKESKEFKVKRRENSEPLGTLSIHFYDPLIEKKVANDQYQVRTYNTGYITFGINVE